MSAMHILKVADGSTAEVASRRSRRMRLKERVHSHARIMQKNENCLPDSVQTSSRLRPGEPSPRSLSPRPRMIKSGESELSSNRMSVPPGLLRLCSIITYLAVRISASKYSSDAGTKSRHVPAFALR